MRSSRCAWVVMVFELVEAAESAGVTNEGARKRVDVMRRDGERTATGGWLFSRYLGNDQTSDVLSDADRAACSACHERAAPTGFVFSRLSRE